MDALVVADYQTRKTWGIEQRDRYKTLPVKTKAAQ
jgi:hypothetical protein